MTETPAPIEDREANIKENIRYIIDRGLDAIYENFDRLHRRGIHDNDVVKALRDLGEEDILDGYAEWGDLDLREDDNTTMDPTVPDPAGPSRRELLAERLAGLTVGITTMQLFGLQEVLPLGAIVTYKPAGRHVEAFTTSKVFVSAGVPVVSLSDGTKAAALTELELNN